MTTPERRPLGQRVYVSPTSTDASPSPGPTGVTIRFATRVNDSASVITIPVRFHLTTSNIQDLTSQLVARISAKPSLAHYSGRRPASMVMTLRDGNAFQLDMDVNAFDSLDCYLNETTTDASVTLVFPEVPPNAGPGAYSETLDDFLAKPPGSSAVVSTGLASTAAAYASQTKRVLALRSNTKGPEVTPGMSPPPTGKPTGHRTPGRIATLVDNDDASPPASSANGGATVHVGGTRSRLFRSADTDTVAGSLSATAAAPRPPSAEVHAAEQPAKVGPRPPRSPEEFVAKPPSRGPSQEAQPPPPRPARMYNHSAAAVTADSTAASQYKFSLLLRDCSEEETSLRQRIQDDEAAAWSSVISTARTSAAIATTRAIDRVEFAHRAQAQAIVASYDDFITHETNRFRLLTTCIEEEQLLRKSARPGYAQAAAENATLATMALKANKSNYISSLEVVARQEVETCELEARNKISEDAVLFFTREAIRNDERYIAFVKGLKEDEESKRKEIADQGFRKLAMFHRQCASGVARLSGASALE